MALNLFGWEFRKQEKPKDDPVVKQQSVSLDDSTDGVVTFNSTGVIQQSLDIYGQFNSDTDLINRYRNMALSPEVELAVDDIINEMVIYDTEQMPVSLNIEEIEGVSKATIDKIHAEFEGLLNKLDFRSKAYDILRSWYVDGRLYYQMIVDPKNQKRGILEIKYLDSRKVRKIREVLKKTNEQGVEIVDKIDEYYVYFPKGTNARGSNTGLATGNSQAAIRLSPDAVVYTTSGLFDSSRSQVVGYLHKAIKPFNQLQMIEDALVIYRLSRAPERRVFYIDVGNLPRLKAEQYLQDQMNRFRNKLVYNAQTGEVTDDRKHMTMLEDFWLPRREGGRGTEVTTLPAGNNLSEIDDIVYFQKKLYKALNVPQSRLDQEARVVIGRSNDVTRDEVKFSRFITRLRSKFSELFDGLLKTQLILKQIIKEDEWDKIKQGIFYDFLRDNHFAELKESEIWKDRLELMRDFKDMVPDSDKPYFTREWVQTNILRLSNEEREELDKEIDNVLSDKDSDKETGKDDMDQDAEASIDDIMGSDKPDDDTENLNTKKRQ